MKIDFSFEIFESVFSSLSFTISIFVFFKIAKISHLVFVVKLFSVSLSNVSSLGLSIFSCSFVISSTFKTSFTFTKCL